MATPPHNIDTEEVSNLIDLSYSYPTEVTYLGNPPTNNNFSLPVERTSPSKCATQFELPLRSLSIPASPTEFWT